MEIKIYDESGKLIKIVPMYQTGGFVLPQYTPTETSMYTPQQSADSFLNTNQRNLEFDQQRYMQLANLELQRDQQLMNEYQRTVNNYNSNAELQLRKQTQERLNKQFELQNEKFKQEVLKYNTELLDQAIKLDDDYLPRDRAAIETELKKEGISDETLLGMDINDTEALYKKITQKKIVLSKHKSSFDNKKMYEDTGKIIDDFDKEMARAEKLLSSNMLDWDQYQKAIQSATNLRKKRLDWAEGKIDVDFKTDPDFLYLQEYRSYINQDNFQKRMDIMEAKDKMQLEQDALENEKKKVEIQQTQQQMKIDEEFAPFKKQQMIANVISDIASSQSKIAAINSTLSVPIDFSDPKKAMESFSKLTQEDWIKINRALNTDQSNKNFNIEQEIFKAYNEGNIAKVNELLDLNQRINGKQSEEEKKRIEAYTGKNSVMFLGEPLTLKDGKIEGTNIEVVDHINRITGKSQRFLKLKKGSLTNATNLNWLMDRVPQWGSFWTNEDLIKFPGSGYDPPGTEFIGDHLFIPADVYVPENSPYFTTQNNSGGTGGTIMGPGTTAQGVSGIPW